MLKAHAKKSTDYIPEGLDEFKSVSRFRTPDTMGLTTRVGTHPLSEQEFQIARNHMAGNPQIVSAFMVFEAGMEDYLTKLEQLMRETTGVPRRQGNDGKSTTIFDTLRSGISSRGIIQEFAALYAYNSFLSEKDGKDTPQAKHSRTMRDALALRSAFISSDVSRIIVCPLKDKIGHILNADIHISENGACTLLEKPKSGGLMQAIGMRLSQTASVKKLEYQVATV